MMLSLQLEKGTEESGPGPCELQIQNPEGRHEYIVNFRPDMGIHQLHEKARGFRFVITKFQCYLCVCKATQDPLKMRCCFVQSRCQNLGSYSINVPGGANSSGSQA